MADGVILPERIETKIVQDFKKITNGQPRMTKQDYENIFLARCKVDKNGHYSLPDGWAGPKEETIGTVLADLDKKFEEADTIKDGRLNIDEYTAMVREKELENYNNNLDNTKQNNESSVADTKSSTEAKNTNTKTDKFTEKLKTFFGNLIKKLFSKIGNLIPL